MDSHARLHGELNDFLRQHCPVCDERHLALLGWMVTGLLLSQAVCFGHWQRRCRRWLSNQRIGVEALYGPLVLWAIQPGCRCSWPGENPGRWPLPATHYPIGAAGGPAQ